MALGEDTALVFNNACISAIRFGLMDFLFTLLCGMGREGWGRRVDVSIQLALKAVLMCRIFVILHAWNLGADFVVGEAT